MDGKPLSISPHDSYGRLGTASAPVVVDVRRPADFAKADTARLIALSPLPAELHFGPRPTASLVSSRSS
jgi:hypothetical protein